MRLPMLVGVPLEPVELDCLLRALPGSCRALPRTGAARMALPRCRAVHALSRVSMNGLVCGLPYYLTVPFLSLYFGAR